MKENTVEYFAEIKRELRKENSILEANLKKAVSDVILLEEKSSNLYNKMEIVLESHYEMEREGLMEKERKKEVVGQCDIYVKKMMDENKLLKEKLSELENESKCKNLINEIKKKEKDIENLKEKVVKYSDSYSSYVLNKKKKEKEKKEENENMISISEIQQKERELEIKILKENTMNSFSTINNKVNSIRIECNDFRDDVKNKLKNFQQIFLTSLNSSPYNFCEKY
jgi:predicted O-linked N-acetylglucosamine transferase (SPINDLY family)